MPLSELECAKVKREDKVINSRFDFFVLKKLVGKSCVFELWMTEVGFGNFPSPLISPQELFSQVLFHISANVCYNTTPKQNIQEIRFYNNCGSSDRR